jgi:hypothetical protein
MDKPIGRLKLLTKDGEVVDAILYCHAETVSIGGVTYRILKKDVSADTAGTTLSASTASVARVVWGKFVFPLAGVIKILSATIYATYRAYTGGGTVNAEIDIKILKSDGTVRTTIATGVSKSANLGSSWATYTGANYSFAEYTVVDASDYLEIDYIANVTAKKASQYAYLRIDDNTLALANQTRSQDWSFSMVSRFVDYSRVTEASTEESYQRKCFYANGRFWVFYIKINEVNGIVYRTSTDGLNWSDYTYIGNAYGAGQFSLYFDGTYLHYVRLSSDYKTYYRRGTPNADGTITWSAVEQLVYSGTSSDMYMYPTISVDSSGHAWIAVQHYLGTYYEMLVLKNANTDGTWSTATGFPYVLLTQSTRVPIQVVPLTSDKMYMVYPPYGILYDGGWGSQETFISDSVLIDAFSAVNEGDNVHVVSAVQVGSSYYIKYYKRTYGVGWSTGVTVAQVTDSTASPALSIATSTLYCFWATSTEDLVYYSKCVNGVWDSTPTTWYDETSDGIYCPYDVTSFYSAYSGYIGVLYETRTAEPYYIKFGFLTVVAVTETIVAKEFPMSYLGKPIKAEELRSKVEGATITVVSKDYPLVLKKKGKQQELVSKWS